MMDVTFTVDLPPEVEAQLRPDDPELSAAARQGYALELYRRGLLDRPGLDRVLGLDRFEVAAFLKRHGVFEGALTHEEVDADVANLKELLGRARP